MLMHSPLKITHKTSLVSGGSRVGVCGGWVGEAGWGYIARKSVKQYVFETEI